jgi:hypothetical protein
MVKKYVFIEDVHAIYKARADSTFAFGKNVGIIVGFLKAFGLTDLIEIKPVDWQTNVTNKPMRPYTRGMPKAKAKKLRDQHKTNLKLESIRAAQQFCPDIDLGDHDGVADAINIGRYGIYLILNGESFMKMKASKAVKKPAAAKKPAAKVKAPAKKK